MCAKLISLFCAVLLLGPALIAEAADVDSSLVGWWRFDEGSGTVARDSSGKGSEAMLLGSPTWGTATRHRGIIVLDGTDDHVSIDGTPFKLPHYTVAIWFRIDGGSGAREILSAKGPS